ncbi:hypothetical protein VE01_08387 [Pseudogymnoascus verrucosus]|uniref:U3 small nucleolar RNA-associated protein 22 n=1 Tax=Pseudogymnoascus verrucosus TaxID=342668 RepID=A0A1B8GBT2_9PEZI|nr:uncharacterized protein VE01_08387 [Pseudogymnoascus verrucosus]OBT93305.1 hypothetical protein VE01_08387 [Pseudogymnoascus verrucosus]
MEPQTTKRRKLDTTAEMPQASDDSNPSVPMGAAATQNPSGTAATMKSHKTSSAAAPFTGDAYNSSLFKLQVEEMLVEVKPNYAKRLGLVGNVLRKLKTLIEAIPDREEMPFHDATKVLLKTHRVMVPFPEPRPDKSTAYKLAYAKPSNVNVVGSYPLKTMEKADSTMVIDMVVTIPASILQEKDYLNYRYFYKRAYYLACIAAGLQNEEEEPFDLSMENLHGNDLQPVLVVKPGKNGEPTEFSKSRCEIRIIPACPKGFFADSKLHPTKNSIRPKAGPTGETVAPAPTPFYNATLQVECNHEAYLKLLHQTVKSSEGFVDACVLGRIWLRQRGFGSSVSDGGFGNFEWAALTALLLQGGGPKGRKALSPGYNSYQLFKGMVQYLATSNMVATPTLIQAGDPPIPKSHLPTFYDGPRGHNVLFKMSASSYDMLRQEAQVSLDMLNDEVFDQFEATFILKKDNPLQQFDSVIKIDGSSATGTVSPQDRRSNNWLLSSKIFNVLKEALGDRVKLIHVKFDDHSRWKTKSSPPSPSPHIQVGLVFDPEHIHRAVDHGPAAEDKKAAETFRNFWGNKSELRRFKDGSILESLVWTKTPNASIFEQIIAYILNRHIGLNPNRDLSIVGDSFDALLPDSVSDTAAFTSLKESFKTLEQSIRDLEQLPLQLKQLSPIGAQLRSSFINAPDYGPRNPLRYPAEVLIAFEGSGRWPDDVVAIQRTKVAFLIKIGELLELTSQRYKAKLGLEHHDEPLLNYPFLDITEPSGAVFRLRIHNDREQTLLENQVKSKSSDAHSAIAALAQYKYMFLQLPLHTQSVATHCTRFPLLSPTMRLVKKWFSAHMLSTHFREELIELLVIRTFLQPYPWRAPSSSMTGFLRTLQFIARWDWRNTPLIVDFGGIMTSKEISAINVRLEAWREVDPGMNRVVLFAATNHDVSGTTFTDGMPSKVVASRMTALARSACKLLKEEGLQLDPKTLFVPSLGDYDFVIYLSPKFAGSRRGKRDAKTAKFKNLDIQTEEDLLYVGYEPARLYVEELRALYTTTMVLFHDESSSNVIAGIWSPQTATRAFKVNMPYATKALGGSEETAGQVAIDKDAIMSEMARLGGDMVFKIELRR